MTANPATRHSMLNTMTKSVKTTKFRCRLQRAFSKWLADNRHRLAIPVSIGKRSDTLLEIQLAGITPAIQITLTESKSKVKSRSLIRAGHIRPLLEGFPAGSRRHAYLSLTAFVDDWDSLMSLDLIEIHQTGGYCCGLCEPTERKIYKTRSELWSGELFEPLAYWINEKLKPARWLLLNQLRGFTWAKLAREHMPESVVGGDEQVDIIHRIAPLARGLLVANRAASIWCGFRST